MRTLLALVHSARDMLASLSADSSPNPDWINALAQELRPSELQVLLSALRQALFGLLLRVADPPERANQWQVLESRLNRVSLALADYIRNPLGQPRH